MNDVIPAIGELKSPLSKSSFSQFEMCAYYWYARKILGIEPPSGEAASIGSEVHKLFELYNSKQLSFNEALAQASSKWVMEVFTLAVENDPFKEGFDLSKAEYEKRILLNEHGEVNPENPTFIAILDRVIPEKKVIYVDDLKTGRSVYDHKFERFAYVAAVHFAYPKYKFIQFSRYYPVAKRFTRWMFEFMRDGIKMTYPDSPSARVVVHSKDFLETTLADAIFKVKNTPIYPKPGRQCDFWFGKECFFKHNGCPAYSNGVLTDPSQLMVVESEPDTSAADLLKQIEGYRVGGEVTPEVVSRALEGVNRLEDYLKMIKEQLKNWSQANGDIPTFSGTYGWLQKNRTEWDTLSALKLLASSGVTMDEIAKVITISKTALKETVPDDLFKNIIASASTTNKIATFGRKSK